MKYRLGGIIGKSVANTRIGDDTEDQWNAAVFKDCNIDTIIVPSGKAMMN